MKLKRMTLRGMSRITGGSILTVRFSRIGRIVESGPEAVVETAGRYAFRGLHSRSCIIGLIAALSFPTMAKADYTLPATLNASLPRDLRAGTLPGADFTLPATLDASLPDDLKVGTIVGRARFAPQEICGNATCSMRGFQIWPQGDGLGSVIGPETPTNVSGMSVRVMINGKAQKRYDDSYQYRIKIQEPIEVQFLIGGLEAKDGTIKGRYFGIYTMQGLAIIDFGGTVKRISGTCSVPAQAVPLPNTSLHKFSGVGSTVDAHSFQIKISNCPKGYNRIGYTLDPVGGEIAGSPGVLPLATDSTASGVKIRIADDKGMPATFGTSVKVDSYDSATGGAYAIPMQASYIQTDATIKPGTVKGAMTVLLDYQ
ncbi:fimbrial protein [Burkholderia sp. AW49-1]